jgi:hypothetical protein
MTYSEEQIEWIVVEVIRRLGLLGATAEAKGAPQSNVESNMELCLSERVVTLRTIEGRLAGAKRLVVVPRTVVTPAVKDELKARKIELVRRG